MHSGLCLHSRETQDEREWPCIAGRHRMAEMRHGQDHLMLLCVVQLLDLWKDEKTWLNHTLHIEPVSEERAQANCYPAFKAYPMEQYVQDARIAGRGCEFHELKRAQQARLQHP